MQSSSEPQITFLHLHALNLFGSWSNVCKKWTVIHLSDARTSHLRTLSKIVRIGLSASSLLSLSFVAEASDRAAHYRVVFVSVNTLLRFFFFLSARVGASRRSHIMGGFDELVNTSFFCLDLPFFRFVETPSVGPRIIGEHLNPSTPQRICFFSRPGSLRHRGGARIVHGSNGFGKGFLQLDAKPCVRNGAIRFHGACLCALSTSQPCF